MFGKLGKLVKDAEQIGQGLGVIKPGGQQQQQQQPPPQQQHQQPPPQQQQQQQQPDYVPGCGCCPQHVYVGPQTNCQSCTQSTAHYQQYQAGVQQPNNLPPAVQQYQQQLQQNQQNGQVIHTPDGNVQLSSCTGKKKALFVGINYFGSSSELHGCINDVQNIQKFLFANYGFTQANSVTLTDDQQNPMFKPTKANILEGMRWLVQGATAGDSLFLHYSGHGGSVKDTDGDDADGYDETIIPVDYESAGFILDDEMWLLLVRGLPQGVRLTAIFDSCHSGTVLDLPYTYKVDGSLEIKMVDNRLEAGKAFFSAGLNYFQGNKAGAFQKAKEGFSFLIKPQESQASQEQIEKRKTAADVIQWGGCKDAQTSADAKIDGKPTGAMSYALIQVLSKNKNITHAELLKETRQILEAGKFSQVPQLSTGHQTDINVPFMM